MSLLANIDHLAVAAGIEAVVVDAGSRDYRGTQTWYPVLDGALDLFKRCDEKSIRLVVGKHTIVVQRESDETVAVVLPTGHAIAKSLRRMIRRMARKDRGPVPKAKPEPVVIKSGPQPTQPAAPVSMPPASPTSSASKPDNDNKQAPAPGATSNATNERGGFQTF
jgi:hypothetical protein